MGQDRILNNIVRHSNFFLDNDQVIGNGSNTVVVWDGLGENTGDIVLRNDGFLLIPGGVDFIRIVAKLAFDPDATGLRIGFITKNESSGYEGSDRNVLNNVGAAEFTFVHLISGVLAVNRGDTFEINVFQDSGGDLNLDSSGSGRDSWVDIQVLDF